MIIFGWPEGGLPPPLSSKQAAVKPLNLRLPTRTQPPEWSGWENSGKLPGKWEPRLGPYDLWMMETYIYIYMETYQICTFIRPQILTLTLLWQAISFQCTVLKRSRSDTLLDKDSAIATISSAWESRRTGVASCSFLIASPIRCWMR